MRQGTGVGRRRASSAAGCLLATLTVAVLAAPTALSSTKRLTAGTAPACRAWSTRTIASGLGVLENLTFDGHGSMLISATQSGAIERMTPEGQVSTLVPGVSYPGGLAFRGDVLYFNTGNSPQAGALGTYDGTIGTYNLDTHARTTWSRNLVMPNGLAFLPDGSAVVTRIKPVIGTPTGMTRITPADPTHPRYNWVALNDTNGLTLDPTGTWLYTDQTFTTDSAVYRIRVIDPSQPQVVAHLAYAGLPGQLAGAGEPKGLDDMGFGPGGDLYVAANGAGQVIQVNPTSGASCVIATGLVNPSSVRAGSGPGWLSSHLYVTSWDGTVRELIPPAG